jgi:alkylhydroperoxidase family enzyme
LTHVACRCTTRAVPRIPAVAPETLPSDIAELGADPYYAILGHRPEVLRAWNELDKVFFGPSSRVGNGIKEEARRTLAQGLGCRFCASLGVPRDEHTDPKEALAVAFAELVEQGADAIDDTMFDVLREEFSEEEIVELVAWICFKYGSNLFGALMKLVPATDDEVKGYADFVATGAAG